jgi:hypothetical protein
MQGNSAKRIALRQSEYAELGLADARRVCQDGFEYGLKLARRATDDLEHPRCRRLLLQ